MSTAETKRQRRGIGPRLTPAAPGGFFTVRDIAHLRNVDEDNVRTWIRSGQLPATMESGKTPSPRYLVRQEDYRRFVEC